MEPSAYQNLDAILAQFGRSPYGPSGMGAASSANAASAAGIPAAAATPQLSPSATQSAYPSLTAEEQALLDAAYPEPAPLQIPPDPPKLSGILQEIAANMHGGVARQRLEQRLRAKQQAQLYNQTAPEEAHAAKAKAALAIVAGRTNSASHNAARADNDAAFVRDMREKAVALGVQDADTMPLHDLFASIASAHQAETGRKSAADSRAEAAASLAQKREQRAEAEAQAKQAHEAGALTENQRILRLTTPFTLKLHRAERELAGLNAQVNTQMLFAGPNGQTPALLAAQDAVNKKQDEITTYEGQIAEISQSAIAAPAPTVHTWEEYGSADWAAMSPAQRSAFMRKYGKKPRGVK